MSFTEANSGGWDASRDFEEKKPVCKQTKKNPYVSTVEGEQDEEEESPVGG